MQQHRWIQRCTNQNKPDTEGFTLYGVTGKLQDLILKCSPKTRVLKEVRRSWRKYDPAGVSLKLLPVCQYWSDPIILLPVGFALPRPPSHDALPHYAECREAREASKPRIKECPKIHLCSFKNRFSWLSVSAIKLWLTREWNLKKLNL